MADSDNALTSEIGSKVNSAETHAQTGLMSPDVTLILMTWVTFFLLLAVLYKFAWKPILTALDTREAAIRKSLEDADRIKEEMDRLDETCQRLIVEAETKAKQLIDQSRATAAEAAKIIEEKARQEADISLKNTLREIHKETQKAQMRLRTESARLAVELASKLIEQNLDDKKNQELIDKFIKEI